MSYEVFISYSSTDKPVADAVCAGLEATGLRCWIAPRDYIAVRRGCDVDQPRNLAKSVTVE